VYSREIEGQEYTFGVSGKLIRNVLVMYDRQTGSLWSQLLGEAVEGPLKGTRLEFLPAWQTTWQDWKTRYPQTLAIQKGYSGSFDPYERYFRSSDAGVIGEAIEDQRLYVKEFVIGVEQNEEAVAYPYSVLNDQPVVNHEAGGVPVLVVFDAETGSGVVFNRELDGQTLTFQSVEGLVLQDEETGSTWDGRSGVAQSGPLAGKTLERLKSTRSFWFGWKDFYPATAIYGIDP
jgi:hypothetical protein